MSSGSSCVAWIFVAQLTFSACAGAPRLAAPPVLPAAAPSGTAPAPARAATLVEAGQAFAASRYAEAEASFRALLAQAGGQAARCGLARTLAQTGRASEARALLRAAPPS